MPATLKNVMDSCVKIVNYIRGRALNYKLCCDINPRCQSQFLANRQLRLLDECKGTWNKRQQGLTSLWELTDFNSYGTPVVPIRKSPLPGQAKASIRVCGDYSVTVN